MINADKTLIMKYNIDSQGNTMAVKIDNEQKQISPIHYCVQLSQVPDEQYRMIVMDDTNNELIEVFNMDEIKENNYYINYTSSVVYFHPSKASKVCIFNYYGLGIELVSASRIYDENSINGQFIVKTIQEIIDKGRECINALSTIGDAVKLLQRIENYIIVATELDIALKEDVAIGQPLLINLNNAISTGATLNETLNDTIDVANTSKTELETTTTNANNKKVELEGTISTANTSKTNLENATITADAKKTELDTSIANAQDDINTINSAGNRTFTIPSTAWVGTEPNLSYVLSHNLGGENLIVGVKENDTKLSIMPNYKYIDSMSIELYSRERVDITVTINKSAYTGSDSEWVSQEVIDARKGEVSLGNRLDGIDMQMADIAIQVELFGAIGDGVASDSIAFQKAINKAITTRYPAIKLQQGRTYLLKATDVSLYDGVFIFGNGATIKLDGIVRFDFQNLDTFICKDLNIETNVGLTEDDTYVYNHMFYSSNPQKKVLFNIENIHVKSTSLQTPKVARYPSVFSLSYHKEGSRIRNLFFENVGGGVILYDGKGAEISNIKGLNVEYLVYLRNPIDTSISDLGIKNTYAESLTWIGKIGGSGGSNGKDTLMIEGGDNLLISDIYGECVIERVIYCQAGNVKVQNIFAKDCQGFKFCGDSYAKRVENAVISNANVILTDDVPTVSNLNSFFELYYISNVEYDGIKLRNFRSDKLTAVCQYIIAIADGTNDIRLKNIDCEYNSALPLIYFYVLQDNTKPCSNIEVENFTIRNYGSGVGDYYIYGFSPTTPTAWINGLNINGGKIIQDDNQILNKNLMRRGFNIKDKKATNVKVLSVDEGYINYITSLQDVHSSYDSSNIAKIKTSNKNIIVELDNNFNLYYYPGYASGAGTLYFPKAEIEQLGINYKAHSSFHDTFKLVYQNKLATSIRLYDAVISAEFDMLVDGTFNNWDFPFNIAGKSYLVEVESSVGCGKAIFNGNTVTEIYKTGNLVFDSTASKLRVRPFVGTVADYFINVSNASGANTRLKIKATLLNLL